MDIDKRWLVGGAVALLITLAVLFGRYQVTVINEYQYVVLDRLTGSTEICLNSAYGCIKAKREKRRDE